MKKITAYILAFTFLLALAGCSFNPTDAEASSNQVDASDEAKASPLQELSTVLGVDCSAGTIETTSETHDAQGQGLTYYVVKFPDDTFENAAADTETWFSLPLTDTLTALTYGLDLDSEEVEAGDAEADDARAEAASSAAKSDADAGKASDDAQQADEEDAEDGDVVFVEDEDMEVDPPIFDEEPDADDLDGSDNYVLSKDANEENDGDEDDSEAFEIEDGDMALVTTIGLFLIDEDGDSLIPEIENGYYFFLDRHSDSVDPLDDEEILDRDTLNVTLAIYDSDHRTLYYCALDE